MKMGEMLAAARKREELSLRGLSRLTGIRNGHLSEFETGVRSNMQWYTIIRLARALKLSLDDLAECD